MVTTSLGVPHSFPLGEVSRSMRQRVRRKIKACQCCVGAAEYGFVMELFYFFGFGIIWGDGIRAVVPRSHDSTSSALRHSDTECVSVAGSKAILPSFT